ncbi:MAG: hypothetical protein R3C52_04670 [Hyphomonadaceae bacterium]
MKKLIIKSAFVLGACLGCVSLPAVAEQPTVEVVIPENLSDPAVAAAYRQDLVRAIRDVCRREATPVVGVNVFVFNECVEATSKEVARIEPTGLFAGKANAKQELALADAK